MTLPAQVSESLITNNLRFVFSTFYKGFSKNKTTWLPVHQNYKELNLAKQKKDEISHYKLYKKLTTLRKKEVLLTGTLQTNVLKDDVLAISRHQKNESIILLINFNNDTEKTVNIRDLAQGHETYRVYVSSIGSSVKWK